MPHAGVYVLASLISGVSTAFILASAPSYTEPRSLQGAAYDVKRGPSTYDGCRAGPCQVAYLNSVEDFCLWAPSNPATEVSTHYVAEGEANHAITSQHTTVAWCMNSVHGPHLIPDGTITGAHLLITPEYVQITGVGKLTNINVPADGVASASGQGHRVHNGIFTSVYGQLEQIHDWTWSYQIQQSFVSPERFCFRACKPSAAASGACPQIHDILECSENIPGDYDAGVFKECIDGATEMPSTFHQEVLGAPSHHPAHPFSSCTTRVTDGNAKVARARRAIVPYYLASHSHSHLRPHGHSTRIAADATTAFPSFPNSPLASATSVSFSTPVPTNVSTSTPYSYNHTHTHSQSHWYSHSHGSSHNYSSTSSPSASSSFSPPLYSHSSSSSTTASSLNNYSSSSPTFPSYSSSDPSGTPTSPVSSASILASTPAPTPSPSFPSPYGSSSSSPGPSSSPYSSYSPSTPYSIATPMSSSTPSTSFFTPSSTSSPSSYVQSESSTLSSSPTPTMFPTSSPSSTSSFTSPSTSSSTSSQSSYVLTFETPSASVPTTSPTSPSHTVPNSETQIGSQCPPYRRVVNAGSVVPPLPLSLTILMIVLASFVV
ncbi:hypothetical protein V8E55_007748 [Tylopilus felleus]